MIEINSNLGGEGNGGVILKEAHLGRDSLVGVTMILNRLAQSKKTLSTIMEGLPHFEMVKDRLDLNKADACMLNPTAVFDTAKSIFTDAEINNLDGLKFSWNSSWLHLRASNTEPILRIYAEAPTKELAIELVQKLKSNV
jgi:phosphomannomutase